MKNVGIVRRMTFVLGASLAVTLGAIISLSYLLRVSSASARSLAEARAKSQACFELLDLVTKVQTTVQKLVQERDPDAIESLMDKNKSLVQEVQAKIDQVATGDSGVTSAFEKLIHGNEEVTNLALQSRSVESHQAFLEKSNPAFEALLGAITEDQKKIGQGLDDQAAQVRSRIAQLEAAIFGFVIVSVLLLVAWGFALVRSVAKALKGVIEMVRDVAEGEGDLTKRLEIASQDELGELAKWFNTFLEKLHLIISQLAGIAERVASASKQISISATAQAQGAEIEKDQTAHVATAMQQMASTVLEVAENCNKAAAAFQQSAQTAREGGAILDETLKDMRVMADSVESTAQKMGELDKSSDQIGRIVGVIDDIADQTNLLALNAAIEAARAGEQGRGFAVVAAEVRKLAERTTTATQEIAQMIKNIQSETKTAVTAMQGGTKQVENGLNSTARAGELLKQIIQLSEQVGEMIVQVASAAVQQSSATEEVNNNMDQISKLVKESAEGAQQAAKACGDLSGLALDLQKMVGNFKLVADNGSLPNQLPAAHEAERSQKACAAAAS